MTTCKCRHLYGEDTGPASLRDRSSLSIFHGTYMSKGLSKPDTVVDPGKVQRYTSYRRRLGAPPSFKLPAHRKRLAGGRSGQMTEEKCLNVLVPFKSVPVEAVLSAPIAPLNLNTTVAPAERVREL